MKNSRIFLLALIGFFSAPLTIFSQTVQEVDGVPFKITSENKTTFQLVVRGVIPTELYNLQNLMKVWHYFCEKYPDKSFSLNLLVFTSDTEEYDKQFKGKRIIHDNEPLPRPCEAEFIRTTESWVSVSGRYGPGGSNELLVYSPDLNYRNDKERVVLAGKDPEGWVSTADITHWQDVPELQIVKRHIYFKPEGVKGGSLAVRPNSRKAPQIRVEFIFKNTGDKPIESATFEIRLICNMAETAAEPQPVIAQPLIYSKKLLPGEDAGIWYGPSFVKLSLPDKQIVRVTEIKFDDGSTWKSDKSN